jgi:hypothetical protein
MKTLPQVETNFSDLYQLTVEPIRHKLLMTALDLKVFNLLGEEKPANVVAETLGTHPLNTRLFLDGLVAGGFLSKKGGLYKNNPEAQAFLVDGIPTYVGQLLISQAEFYEQVLVDIPSLIKNGPPPEEEMAAPQPEEEDSGEEESSDPSDLWKYASMGIASFEKKLGDQILDIVKKLPEYPGFKKMLDMGSGPGIFSISFVKDHPKMNSVIFDRKEIVCVAERFFEDYDVEDRISTMAGSYQDDPIGEGYDFVWACGSLNAGKAKMDVITEKAYKALNKNGIFISLHEGLTQELTKPATHALTMTPMGMKGKDLCFEQGYIVNHMLNAGFSAVRSMTLDTPYGPMDMDIGKKL